MGGWVVVGRVWDFGWWWWGGGWEGGGGPEHLISAQDGCSDEWILSVEKANQERSDYFCTPCLHCLHPH